MADNSNYYTRENIDNKAEVARIENMVEEDNPSFRVWDLINYFTDIGKLGIPASDKVMKFVLDNNYFGSRTLKMKYDKFNNHE